MSAPDRRGSLWPRSLFGRLALLLVGVLVAALLVTILLFRHDRAELLARQFGDTLVVQLQALRVTLETVDAGESRDTLRRIGREYGARIVPDTERQSVGAAPSGPVLRELERRLRVALGDGTVVRVQPRLQLVWVRIAAAGNGYWVGFPLPARPRAEDAPSRALLMSISVALCLLIAAFAFARYLARPLRELNHAMVALGRGRTPDSLPEAGPTEIANLNRGFNRMLADLRRVEHDRALLLAGVSHDLRTPLARLRVAIEMGVRDERARHGMSDDIDEMDRIIGQFLDFARDERGTARVSQHPDPIVAGAVERYARTGQDVRFTPGAASPVALRPTALSRLLTNLIENALAYGAAPVEVRTSACAGRFTLEVRDHGPGIPPGEAERLKQPFTRASSARANAAGIAGAGLGLAIVERIARLHGGTFDLLPAEGGGTLARVELPVTTA